MIGNPFITVGIYVLIGLFTIGLINTLVSNWNQMMSGVKRLRITEMFSYRSGHGRHTPSFVAASA